MYFLFLLSLIFTDENLEDNYYILFMATDETHRMEIFNKSIRLIEETRAPANVNGNDIIHLEKVNDGYHILFSNGKRLAKKGADMGIVAIEEEDKKKAEYYDTWEIIKNPNGTYKIITMGSCLKNTKREDKGKMNGLYVISDKCIENMNSEEWTLKRVHFVDENQEITTKQEPLDIKQKKLKENEEKKPNLNEANINEKDDLEKKLPIEDKKDKDSNEEICFIMDPTKAHSNHQSHYVSSIPQIISPHNQSLSSGIHKHKIS